MAFYAKLNRRKVPRAALLYIGAVWAFGQGLSQFSPALGLPDLATRWFLITACIGFPFWIALAWFFEFTPGGLKRETEIDPTDPIAHHPGSTVSLWVFAMMAVAIVLLMANQFVWRIGVQSGHAATYAAFAPPIDSLVVLPFANLVSDPKQQYFSDGITEELTSALGQNTALRVIAWDTASSYRDPRQTPSAIGKALNVANLLHGSIAREGDQVRITAELVDTVTGYQLWSAHYDRPFEDIFAVQDQVSQAIATALQVKFAQGDLSAGGTRNAQAHELVLKGRALRDREDATSLTAARAYFEQAIALDPNYADAHALLAHVDILLTYVSDFPLREALPKVRMEAHRALALDPHNEIALVALASADDSDLKFDQARNEFQQAVTLDPSDPHARMGHGLLIPLKASLAENQVAATLSPHNVFAQMNLATSDLDMRDFGRSLIPAQAAIRLNPANVDAAFLLAFAYQHLHRGDAAIKAFDLVQPSTPKDQELIDAGRLAYQARADPGLRQQALAALNRLRIAKTNPDVQVNLVTLYLALDETETALELLDVACAANPLICNDAAINPLFDPLRGNPRFEELSKKYTTMTLE